MLKMLKDTTIYKRDIRPRPEEPDPQSRGFAALIADALRMILLAIQAWKKFEMAAKSSEYLWKFDFGGFRKRGYLGLTPESLSEPVCLLLPLFFIRAGCLVVWGGGRKAGAKNMPTK